VAEKMRVMTLVERKDISPDLAIFRFQTDTKFVFEAGQFCVVSLGGVKRPYSVFSSPQDPDIELLIKLVPGGALTTLLWKLSPGDRVEMFQARGRGNFLFDESVEHHAMFATGTGIAPFRSMVRHYAATGRWKFYIFQGVSYVDELSACCLEFSKTPHVIHTPAVSRPNDPRNTAWDGVVGRLPEQASTLMAKFGLTPANSIVYACGHLGMVEGIKEVLGPEGFKIKEEKY